MEEVEDTGSMESMVDLDNNRTSIQANVATDNSPETDDLDLDDELVILEDYPKVEFLTCIPTSAGISYVPSLLFKKLFHFQQN